MTCPKAPRIYAGTWQPSRSDLRGALSDRPAVLDVEYRARDRQRFTRLVDRAEPCAPRGVTLDSLTISGRNIKAQAYFISATTPPPVGLRLTNIVCPIGCDYTIKLDSGSQGLPALLRWAPDALISDGDLTGATEYPR